MTINNKRPAGSDGSDHWHRESIAWHYKVLAENKPRLKTNLVMHIPLTIAMIIRLLPIVISYLGFVPAPMLQRWNYPADPWQWVWLCSILFVPIAWRSMQAISISLVIFYLLGILGTGTAPILYAIVDYYKHFYDYYTSNKMATLACCVFLAIALQIHVFGAYFALVLSKAYYKVQKSKSKDRKYTR